MEIGFETEQILQNLVVMHAFFVSNESEFKQSCREIINVILEKVLEKSLLNTLVVTNSSAFDLQSMSLPKDSSQKR